MEKDVIKKLPKVELHCHLDGSISIDLIKILLAKANQEVPSDEQLRKQISVDENCDNLSDYLACFDFILPLLQTQEALTLAAYDVLKQAAVENVCYMELRFAPSQHQRNELSMMEVVSSVMEGVEKATRDFGITCTLLLCMMRNDTDEKNEEVIRTANTLKAKHPLGIDLAGDENFYETALFETLISLVTSSNLPMTLHAGESGNAKNIMDSVQFGALRIGHGLAMREVDEIKQMCQQRKVLVELCPTSNLQTKAIADMRNYPLMDYVKANIPISINTDNRTVSNTTLSDEYILLGTYFDIPYTFMEAIAMASIQHSFATEELKAQLIAKMKGDYESILQDERQGR